jgi:CRP/FNR family cyclic AMP-dependent transcriptional regulator
MSRVPTAGGAALRAIPVFATLDGEDVTEVLAASRACRYPKGSVIFQEGDPGDFLLLLLAGRAKVLLQNDEGREVILSVVEPPEVLGHLALLDGAPRSATVVALDAVEARKLTRERFLDLMARSRPVLEGLLRTLAAHLRDTNEQVRTALMCDVHGQVLRALVRRGRDRDAGHIVVEPRPSHQELAQMIGKSRETVTRALAELKDAGYVTVLRTQIAIRKVRVRRYWRPGA